MKTIEFKLYAVKPVGGWTTRSIRRMRHVVNARTLSLGSMIQQCEVCTRVGRLCNATITVVRIDVSGEANDIEINQLIAAVTQKLYRYLHLNDQHSGSVTVSFGSSQVAKPPRR